MMWGLCQFPLITDTTGGRKNKVDERWVLSPNTRSKSGLFEGADFKIWEQKNPSIVEIMHYSSTNISASFAHSFNYSV